MEKEFLEVGLKIIGESISSSPEEWIFSADRAILKDIQDKTKR